MILPACDSPSESAANGATTDGASEVIFIPEMGYRIHKPDKKYTLPGSLAELSGMQSLNDSLIACIQDEKGIIFLFDLQSEKVVEEISWGAGGDYEGIAGHRKVLWVLESNGTLNRISNFAAGATPVVKKMPLAIERGCDAEGLCLTPDHKTLLIACKAGIEGERNIWKFDLATEQLVTEPYLVLQEDDMEAKLIESDLDKISLGLYKFLNVKGESGILAPSGIAFHPLTKDLFVLSAASKTLTVLDHAGEVKWVQELPSQFFPQPESITFTPNGTLLIGNEGKGIAPTILLFTYDEA